MEYTLINHRPDVSKNPARTVMKHTLPTVDLAASGVVLDGIDQEGKRKAGFGEPDGDEDEDEEYDDDIYLEDGWSDVV